MDDIVPRDRDFEVDLENGIKVSVEDSSKNSISGVKIQEKKWFAKISSIFVDETIKSEEGVNLRQAAPNLSGVSAEQEKLDEGTNADCVVKKVAKEKRKSMSNKKPPKPPRPPRGPSLDSADQKLIKEIAEIAMLKRARIERMKALKKMKAAKVTSSNSNVFAMMFTVLFFLVILFQGISSGVTSVKVQKSPISVETPESDLIAVQFFGNPSAGDSNEPSSGPPNSAKPIVGFDPPENMRRAVG